MRSSLALTNSKSSGVDALSALIYQLSLQSYLYHISPFGILCVFHSCTHMNVCGEHKLSGLYVYQSCFPFLGSKALGGQGPFCLYPL